MSSQTNLGSSSDPDYWGNFFFNNHLTYLYWMWILADIPILLGMFGKSFGISYRVHSLTMTVVCAASVVLVAAQHYNDYFANDKLATPRPPKKPLFEDPSSLYTVWGFFTYITQHEVMAKIIFTLIAIQAIGGSILERIYLKRNSIISLYKKYARIIHLVGGLLLWLCAKIQLYLKQPDFHEFPWINYNLVIVSFLAFPSIAIILKVVLSLPSLRKPSDKLPKNLKPTKEQLKIVQMLRENTPREKLIQAFPNKFVFLYEDRVYDLTNYTHPGGHIFFVNQNWKDISRFLKGGRKDERTGATHSHSAAAFMALNSHVIGSLSESGLNSIIEEGATLYGSLPSVVVFPKNSDWVVDNIDELSPSFNLVRLIHSNTSIKINVKDVSHFGKFYYVDNGNQRVPEHLVHSLDSQGRAYINQVANMVLTGTDSVDVEEDSPASTQLSVFSNMVNLVQRSKASTIEDSVTKGQVFKIEGPFGCGLGLSATFNGRCVILAEDDGYVPFIDLFEFLVRKTAHNYFTQSGRENLLFFVKTEQDYEQIYKNASFKFFGIFDSVDDFVNYNLVKNLHLMNKEHKMDLFSAEITLRNPAGRETGSHLIENKFDADFVHENVVEASSEVDRLILSGSDAFYKKITGHLDKFGYPRGRIVYI